MAAIITSKFRFHNAEQFKESFSEAAATNYYLFIGRPSAFASGTTGGTDSAPPTPVDNRRSEAYEWDDMLAAKKIDTTGVTHAIPRRDLDVSGATTYDMYRPNYSSANPANSGATTLFDSTFYFMTSAYRVYKVLENKGNTAWTTAEPTSEAAPPFTESGYKIKYMFKLTTTQVQNFLTPDFIPLSITPETNNARTDGALDVIKVTTAGLSLVGGNAWAATADRIVVNVPIRGDGTGGLSSVTIGGVSGTADGTITSCTVTTAGSSYTHGTVLPADIIEQHDIQNSGEALTFDSNPAFEVIIGPDGGHGSNPAKELGGHFCLTDVKLQQTEGFDFSVVNDFRQIGIVRNPYSYGTTSNFTGSTCRQTYAVILASNSGTFTVDEKIFQTIAPAAIANSAGMAIDSEDSTKIIVTTAAVHKLTSGQMIKVTGGSWATNATGHLGTHHITTINTTSFSYNVTASIAPSGAFTKGSCAYTTFQPQGIVVEWDATNKILFYVQNVYDNQGTDSTYKQNIPFGDNGTIEGDTSEATGVPDTANNGTYNNTVFVAGYTNPELQPDSGDIIYIENRKPISRASDQTEDVKLVVEF
jgi:hypothetical protein